MIKRQPITEELEAAILDALEDDDVEIAEALLRTVTNDSGFDAPTRDYGGWNGEEGYR